MDLNEACLADNDYDVNSHEVISKLVLRIVNYLLANNVTLSTVTFPALQRYYVVKITLLPRPAAMKTTTFIPRSVLTTL